MIRSPHRAAAVLVTAAGGSTIRRAAAATRPSPASLECLGHPPSSSSSAPAGRRGLASAGSDPRRSAVVASNDDDQPWWSLSSLHRRAATIIFSSLPDESLSEVHVALSERLGRATTDHGHKSASIGEAIVSARAREAHLQSRQSPDIIDAAVDDPLHSERMKKMEEEMERRAIEKARERMVLEMKAMEAKLRRDEEERIREERERLEREYRREAAFERWKEDAAREMRQEEEEKKGTGATMNGALPRGEADRQKFNGRSSREVVNGSARSEQQQQQNRQQTIHPVLGPQIAQLPYKRVHLTSAATLASLPVYEKQRAYRHDRARVMARDKKKTLWMGMPGVISLMEHDDGRLSILDGQHRVGMMSLLQEEQRKIREKANADDGDADGLAKGSGGAINGSSGATSEELSNLDLDNVLVEVFSPRPTSSSSADSVLAEEEEVGRGGRKSAEQRDGDSAAAAIFTEINKAEPVKLLDLPGMATKRTRDIIDHATSHFADAFPVMFSPSQRCRAPHLNVDNLREALFASEVIKRERMGSGGELVGWMARRNEELRENYGEGKDVDDNGEGKRVSEAALKKARKHDFYLGLESMWLYK